MVCPSGAKRAERILPRRKVSCRYVGGGGGENETICFPTFFERLVDSFFQLRRQPRIQPDRGGRSPVENGFGNNRGSFSAKRQNAGSHFVQHHAEGKKIGSAIQFLPTQLLGRHVGHGADRGSRIGEVKAGGLGNGLGIAASGAGGARNLCQSKIENFGVPAIGHENVCGLNVTMHDALGVRGIERVGYLNAQSQ
jgi:hypothetical protein